ncbi:MAG: 50S ribosomal protein L32 [Aquificae bacterium]|nr:50S ribosomal protein L32 [Aquificota bacterium]
MAVPKTRKSKAKTAMRKAHWYNKVKAQNLVPCPHCGEPIKPHRVCPFCGYYKDRQELPVEEEGLE